MHTTILLKKVRFKLTRIVWRLFCRISPGRLHTFTLPGGGQFRYPLASAVGEYLFSGWFEPAEVEFIKTQLKPGDTVLDVGANAGLYTVIAARAVGPEGHVYAFEPDQRALSLLKQNVALNGLRNVTVIEAAASNTTGEARFALAADTALSSLADLGRPDQEIGGWTTVPTIRLDDAISRHSIGPVRFIKMDVEGAEQLVVQGATRLLGGTAPLTILLEGFDQNTQAFGYSVRDLLGMLEGLGFSLYGFDRSLQLRPIATLESGIGTTVYNFVARKP